MNQLQRNYTEPSGAPALPAGNPAAGELNELRRQAAALHAAADDAIQKALSTNSRAFIASMRQEGGQ